METKEKFWVTVPGDYMAPEFLPGDRLLVDPGMEAEPGSYVLAELAGKWHLAQLTRGKKGTLRMKHLRRRGLSVPAEYFNIIGRVVQRNRDV